MNRRYLLLFSATLLVAGLPMTTEAQSLSDLTSAAKDPLVSMLTSKLGVTENQAKGGMGSMLALAKEKMASADFSKLTGLLPQAAKYQESAKQLGAVTGPVKNSTGLNAAFAKLGIKPETAALFVPTVADYVGKIGGAGAKNMLLAALK
jgi:hypothetical protein